jgi:hypothetical protein
MRRFCPAYRRLLRWVWRSQAFTSCSMNTFLKQEKKKKTDFKEAMSHSIGVLTTPTVRKCDRKARTYIQAYYYLEVMRQGEGTGRNRMNICHCRQLRRSKRTSKSTAAPLTSTDRSVVVLLTILCNIIRNDLHSNKLSLFF